MINGLLLALDVISPGVAGYYQKYFRGLSSSRDPAFKWTTEWRELAAAAGGQVLGRGDRARGDRRAGRVGWRR